MEGARFFCQKKLLQYLKTIKVYRSCIWLCDFMFYNTCILFSELFICKVLGFRFFYYKVMIYFLIFFSLGPELKTDQAFQPLAPPCPRNLARKNKEWIKLGSKWKCKDGTYIVTYYVKWLLTKHFKEVHGLVAKKAKPKKLSTFEKGPWHQNHAKMNVRILGNATVLHMRKD
jgi:hypothetical protein